MGKVASVERVPASLLPRRPLLVSPEQAQPRVAVREDNDGLDALSSTVGHFLSGG